MSTTVRSIAEKDFFLWYPLFSRYAGGSDETPISDRIAVQLWQWLTTGAESLQGRLLVDEGNTVLAVAHVRSVALTRTATRALVIDDLFVADDATASATTELFDAVVAEAKTNGYAAVRWQDNVGALEGSGDLVEDLWRELTI